MIRFQRTDDMEQVRKILAIPALYRRMTDDSAPYMENFTVPHSDRYLPILAIGDLGPCAVFLLVPRYPASAEVHFAFLPSIWGTTGDICRQFIEWVWRTTSLKRLYGPVPRHNSLALRLAKSVGFTEVGVSVGAIMRHGVPCDLLLLEMGRP